MRQTTRRWQKPYSLLEDLRQQRRRFSSSCRCAGCIDACLHTPGWFLPGEAEDAAAYLGMSLPEFFRDCLGVQWWTSVPHGDDIFVLAPAFDGMGPGQEYPYDPTGRCVFLSSLDCIIHPVKPFECIVYDHGEEGTVLVHRRETVAKVWVPYQNQIAELLGREPIARPPEKDGWKSTPLPF